MPIAGFLLAAEGVIKLIQMGFGTARKVTELIEDGRLSVNDRDGRVMTAEEFSTLYEKVRSEAGDLSDDIQQGIEDRHRND